MTTLLPAPKPQPPAAGLFGSGSTADRAALRRPPISPSQRAGFAALFRLEEGSSHLS